MTDGAHALQMGLRRLEDLRGGALWSDPYEEKQNNVRLLSLSTNVHVGTVHVQCIQ